jgi:hypothetical protein
MLPTEKDEDLKKAQKSAFFRLHSVDASLQFPR